MSDAFTPLSYAVATLVCALTAIGLRRGHQKDETWLPSFAASTTLKALILWGFCISVPVCIRAYHNGDNMVEFGIFLLFPAAILFTSLVSMFTYLLFRLAPKARKTQMPTDSRTRAVCLANAALLCVGVLMAGVAAIMG